MANSRYGPAALAALLLEAPQCVPYARRVEVFRSLIAGLKNTCAHFECCPPATLLALPNARSDAGSEANSLRHPQWRQCVPTYACARAAYLCVIAPHI